MLEWYQGFVLAMLQGLTEFLPISSSGHLVLPSLVLGWPDQGLAFDVAVHLGTLFAVVWYYRADLLIMSRDWSRSVIGGARTEDSQRVWYLLVATIPAGVVGIFGRSYIESELRSLLVVATTTLVFGLALGVADRFGGKSDKISTLSLGSAFLIGVAQAMALVPGVSRSGVTITAGLLLGFGRQGAARFSFLMSIPVIAGAAALKTWDLLDSTDPVQWPLLALGALVSGLTAYFSIAVFLRLLDRVGLIPFVYYRTILALVLYAMYLL